MEILSLGDEALLVRGLGHHEAVAWARSGRLEEAGLAREVWAAFGALGVQIFPGPDPRQAIAEALKSGPPHSAHQPKTWEADLRLDGPDLDSACAQLGLTPSQLAAGLTESPLPVLAIGFCPGFPYLGPVPEPMRGLARLPSPRSRVQAGSVGLAGDQACIYPLVRPGGWPLVGSISPEAAEELAQGAVEAGDEVWLRA